MVTSGSLCSFVRSEIDAYITIINLLKFSRKRGGCAELIKRLRGAAGGEMSSFPSHHRGDVG